MQSGSSVLTWSSLPLDANLLSLWDGSPIALGWTATRTWTWQSRRLLSLLPSNRTTAKKEMLHLPNVRIYVTSVVKKKQKNFSSEENQGLQHSAIAAYYYFSNTHIYLCCLLVGCFYRDMVSPPRVLTTPMKISCSFTLSGWCMSIFTLHGGEVGCLLTVFCIFSWIAGDDANIWYTLYFTKCLIQ